MAREVIRIHPQGTMIIYKEFQSNPSNSSDISVCTEAADQPDLTFSSVTLLAWLQKSTDAVSHRKKPCTHKLSEQECVGVILPVC